MLLAQVFTPAAPAHALSTLSASWLTSTSLRLSGSALSNPVTINGSLSAVFGGPAGTQSFLSNTNGPTQMSFGCTVSIALNIYPDAAGNLDYSHGEYIFTYSPPSTCTLAQLNANIGGLTHDPNSGTTDISLMNVAIANVNNRNPTGGTDDAAHQIVNVTSGMGPSSANTNIPQNDTYTICEAKGAYATNATLLMNDCLANKAGAVTAGPTTSGNLQTLTDGKGPNNGDEKGWTGQFTGIKAGQYVVCSKNFNACTAFTKNPGQILAEYITFGTTPTSTIPGTPPATNAASTAECTTGPGLAGALAWILCPAVQLIASATTFFENNIIIPFLTVSPLTTNANNPIYILWQDVRNIANIGFILFFFFVIFSQTTSIGISNYGIKRIMPRMVIVVVGSNLSYFIVAVVIDAFNIMGGGISALVIAALHQAGTTQLNSGTSAGPVQSIFVLGGAALLTIVTTGGEAIGWLFSFLGIAALVVVVAVIVLVVRQIAIIGLTIISPLAILASMLPNTEDWYTKFRQTLTKLLAMYPYIVLLFAGGKIFAFILGQPNFILAGNGVSNDVAQAVRVGFQFVANAAPLAGLPAAFAAGGFIVSRVSNGLHGRLVKPRVSGLTSDIGETAKRRAGEARMRLANNTNPTLNRAFRRTGVSTIAGIGMRRQAAMDERAKNLKRQQEAYVANAMGNSAWLRRRAAGVAGTQGQTRAAASAASVASKNRAEDIDNEVKLLESEFRRLGTNQKEFASKAAKYLEDPSVAANQVFTGSNGQTFNFAQNSQRFGRAYLDSAASQGEIKAVENARLNLTNPNDQLMLDDIIRRNDGKLKEKGGYHLATDFKLANGRMQIYDPGTGNYRAPVNAKEAQNYMQAQRILAMAQSGANSVAGMKAGILRDTADALGGADKAAIIGAMDSIMLEQTKLATPPKDATELRTRLKGTMNSIITNPNTKARTEASDADLNGIFTNII